MPSVLDKRPLDNLSSEALTWIEDDVSAKVILDWKGEKMDISPGDKLPFKFL